MLAIRNTISRMHDSLRNETLEGEERPKRFFGHRLCTIAFAIKATFYDKSNLTDVSRKGLNENSPDHGSRISREFHELIVEISREEDI